MQKTSQLYTLCNGDTACIKQLKQKKNKKVALTAWRHVAKVLKKSNSTCLIFAV